MSSQTRRPVQAPLERGRCRGDDGALIVELAFVAPLMILLLLGIFEFGTVYRNQNILANAVRAAARVESQQANTATVDQLAIKTFMASTSGLKNMTLVALVVFEAPSGGIASANCRNFNPTGSPPYGEPAGGSLTSPGVCNYYTASMAQQVANDKTGTTNADFGCNGASSSSTTWDGKWCPVNAVRPTSTLTEPMTEVGVWAKFTYHDVTSLMPGGTMTITDSAVFAIQPQV